MNSLDCLAAYAKYLKCHNYLSEELKGRGEKRKAQKKTGKNSTFYSYVRIKKTVPYKGSTKDRAEML